MGRGEIEKIRNFGKDLPMMPFYIYRHIRPDKNEVFYIGKGNRIRENRGEYSRANWKYYRNDLWNKIVNKNNGVFDVEIIYECETENECNRKEIEFIKLYGRRDNNTGTLANMTDGGEGVLGFKFNEESKKKMSIAQLNSDKTIRGKKLPKDWAAKISNSLKGRKQGKRGDGKWKQRMVIDTDSGVIYESITDAAISLGINRKYLYCMLYGNNKNKTTLTYYDGESL